MTSLKGPQKLLMILLILACMGTTSLVFLSVVKQQQEPDAPTAKPRVGVTPARQDIPTQQPSPGVGGSDDNGKTVIGAGNSTPAPNFTLTDSNFRPFGSDELYGKVWVVNFIFTRCSGPCPAMTSKMAELQLYLMQSEVFDQVNLVSITVDPEHDRPEVLAKYADMAKMHQENWHFLTGTRNNIWELIEDGFKLPVGDDPENTDMPIMHSQRFVLVDRFNTIRGYYDGLSPGGKQTLLNDMLKLIEEPGPEIPSDSDESTPAPAEDTASTPPTEPSTPSTTTDTSTSADEGE